MKKNDANKYRYTMKLPVELEDGSRKRAYNLGFIIGNRGALSGYIQLLIHNDLLERLPLDTNDIISLEQGDIKRLNITIDKEYIEKADERARELGFIWGQGGNISRYVQYLLMRELNKIKKD